MVASSGVLAGLARYDGVLGTTDPDQFLAGGGGQGTFRVVVTGGPAEAAAQFDRYRAEFVLPLDMEAQMQVGAFVPIQFEGAQEPVAAYLLVGDFVPEPGATLVVVGRVETEWPLVNDGPLALSSMPAVFVDPDKYHEPLLFKR